MASSFFKISFVFLLIYGLSCSQTFPEQYLVPDENPTAADLDLYLFKVDRLTRYQVGNVNYTDGNNILAHVLLSSYLLRTLRDYKDKLGWRVQLINELLVRSDDYLTHMTWSLRGENESLARLRDTTKILADTMGTFNRDVLPKFVLNGTESEFSSYFDDLSLPKENYAALVEQYLNPSYPITAPDSDQCISSLNWNIVPSHSSVPLRQCKAYKMCFKKIFKKPSIAYNLSHRLVSQLLYLMAFRCYLRSEEEDYRNFHELCAGMYHETVYIARRGFFAIDMFFEHVGLCCMGGYEEFHRRRWFLKAARLINNNGCVKEFPNFSKNRTAALLAERGRTPENIERFNKILVERIMYDCQPHEMAVGAVILGAAIRHAAHYLPPFESSQKTEL